MYVIQSGTVELMKKTRRGEGKSFATLEKGDFFGEMSILEDVPRTATARAKTDCELIRIDQSTFDEMLRHNTEIAVRMLRKLSRRLRETTKLLEETTGMAPSLDEASEVSLSTSSRHRTHRIVAESGEEFFLSNEDERPSADRPVRHPARRGPGQLDNQRSVSRRHSKIMRRQLLHRGGVGTITGRSSTASDPTGQPMTIRTATVFASGSSTDVQGEAGLGRRSASRPSARSQAPGHPARTARDLAGAGVETVLDLLLHLPFRYEDRTNLASIRTLVNQQPCVTVRRRLSARLIRTPRRASRSSAILDDGTGSLRLVFFSQPSSPDGSRAGRSGRTGPFLSLVSGRPRSGESADRESLEGKKKARVRAEPRPRPAVRRAGQIALVAASFDLRLPDSARMRRLSMTF
jgi:hypothetical protein